MISQIQYSDEFLRLNGLAPIGSVGDAFRFTDFEVYQDTIKDLINERARHIATTRETMFYNALRAYLMREPTLEDAANCIIAKHPQRGSFDTVETIFYDEVRLGVLVTKQDSVEFIYDTK